MMPHSRWILMQGTDHWLIVQKSAQGATLEKVDVVAGDDKWAGQVVRSLESRGYRGEAVLLGVASSACMVRTATMEDAATARDRRAMSFALESWIPVPAEEVVADFIVAGREVMGVAVETAAIASVVAALEQFGVAVQSIVPTALLGLQHHLQSERFDFPHLVLWGNAGHVELFFVYGGKPREWRLLPSDSGSLVREFEVMALSHLEPLRVVAYDLSDELLHAISNHPDIRLEKGEARTMAAAAAAGAESILSGAALPLIELRREALAPVDPYQPVRGAIRFATVAAAMFLLISAGALLFRAQRYEWLAHRLQDEQTKVFRTTLPGQPVPVGIRSRLESEYTRLSGLTGEASDIPTPISAVTTLHAVLAALPDEPRSRVIDLRIDNGRVYLEGEVRAHGDTDRIAASLRQAGFEVDPPHSQQLAEGIVSLRLNAVHRAQAPQRPPAMSLSARRHSGAVEQWRRQEQGENP